MKELAKFTQLRTLNLDNNSIEYMEDIPEFSSLDTLSIAYNDLTDVDNLIENVLEKVGFSSQEIVPAAAIFESAEESAEPAAGLRDGV